MHISPTLYVSVGRDMIIPWRKGGTVVVTSQSALIVEGSTDGYGVEWN